MVENQNIAKRENNDIINPDMDKREFKITIGIRSYWITREELEKYLRERKVPGVDLVALRGGLLFLPAQCQEIVHRSVIDASDKISNGRWQCEHGNWHGVGNDCTCNLELVDAGDGMLRLQEKAAPTLPEPTPSGRPAARYLSVKSF